MEQQSCLDISLVSQSKQQV